MATPDNVHGIPFLIYIHW